MNYKEALLVDHSRVNADRIVKAIGNKARDLDLLVDIVFNAQAPLPQRASWIVSIVDERHPDLLEKHLENFINQFRNFSEDAVKRNFMHVIANHRLAKRLQGKAATLCFDLILSPDETVAVKVFALQTIANIAQEEPGLIPEMNAVIEDQLPKTTAAFAARVRLIRKEFALAAARNERKKSANLLSPSKK